jgi:dipeptidyl aminopeptidase/acylaminoacyl peptidase
MEKIKHIAQYVVHGSADKTVPVAASRAMVEAARKLGATVMYVEVPGGGHGDVVAPEFAHMLDFFARQRRPQ